jgi:hypothetical protein
MEQIFRRTSSNLANFKERRVLTNILPLVDTKGSVKELTLFLPGRAPLQSSRIKSSVAWLEIFRPGTRHCRIWRTLATFSKTSLPCDVSKKPYKRALPYQHWYLISIYPATSTTMTNHDPRMNRISSIVLVELPPNTTSIRRSWYMKYLMCLTWLFVDCLVCSWYCLQLPCALLEWVLLPSACAYFWPLVLKTPSGV